MMELLLGLPKQVADLLARLTSTRATNLDNLDATTSSRAPASTALSTTNWTSGRAANLDNLDALISSRLGAIKSMQRGYIQIASGATFQTATITAVVPPKSLLMLLGWAVNDTGFNGNNDTAHLTFTNSTTITATRFGNGTTSPILSYQVVEFN
jgi:hypothetical protein